MPDASIFLIIGMVLILALVVRMARRNREGSAGQDVND